MQAAAGGGSLVSPGGRSTCMGNSTWRAGGELCADTSWKPQLENMRNQSLFGS